MNAFSAGTAEELAAELYKKGSGNKNNKPNKVDTVKLALDRQQTAAPACSIGNAQYRSAFQVFAGPPTHPSHLTEPSPARESAANAGIANLGIAPHTHVHAAPDGRDGRSNPVPDAMDGTPSGRHDQSSSDPQQQDQQQQDRQWSQSRSQLCSAAQALHQYGQPVQSDRKQEPSHGAVHAVANANPPAGNSYGSSELRPPGDVAVLDKFRDMEGEAWKVFYTASKMGVRSDVIERAAVRLRTLQSCCKD